MTLRVTMGIDPGMAGCIAILADGEPIQFIDMPIVARDIGNGNAVDAFALPELLRDVKRQHHGAAFQVWLEYVNARPPMGRDGQERSMGATTGARMAEGFGVVKGVLGALGLKWQLVWPQRWKAHFGLLKQEKDAARLRAIELAPAMAAQLARKKDGGRGDALLIALYGWHDENRAEAA